MDIPLPDDPPANENVEESLSDIPVPEDVNSRYSPSLPIEDDPTEQSNDLSTITLPSDPLNVPSQTPAVSVLGKEAAKKRLLAFSQTKFSLISQKRKASLGNVDSSFTKEGDTKSIAAKKKKKGVLDKARDTISEIEELKRRENEVMETMQVLFPMWSNSDKKITPDTSLIIPDGVVEKSDRMDNAVEKLLLKKMRHERREYEKKDRSVERERRKKREWKQKMEMRRLMPKSWAEFNKSRFKAYHFRRQKFKLEQLGEGMKSKERNRSHEHEREGSKKINLFDTPMVLKKPLVVSGVNNKDIEFPSWAVRYTNTWPPISYCINPKYEHRHFMSRKEMYSTLPDNIYAIVKKFLSSSSCNKFEKQKVTISRSWWERDSFLIPSNNTDYENQSDPTEDIDKSEANESMLESTYDELNNYTEDNESEKLDLNSIKSITGSPPLSSEGPSSDIEKSCDSDSETEKVEGLVCKSASPSKQNNSNDGNLASEYEQFIKTIGPNTDSKEISETIDQGNDGWPNVSEANKESNSFREETNKKKKEEVENSKKFKNKKLSQKKRKIKKKASKRSHSPDSSSSESSSKSSSSSRSSSSSSRSSSASSSSSSSSSASSSSSSSSSSDSSSSSSDSSSESSTTSTSSGSSSSSDSPSVQKKSKKIKRKRESSKKVFLNKRSSKSKKASKQDVDEQLETKKNKKNEEPFVKKLEELKKANSDEEADDIPQDSPHGSLSEAFEISKKCDDNSIIRREDKKSQAKVYDAKDYSPQSRTTDDDLSDLSNNSLKSIISETVVTNEQKEANSLDWNSAEDSASNEPVIPNNAVDNKCSPLEGKRHFNLDIFQESYNCTSDVSSPREGQIVKNDLGTLSPQNNSKQESKEENDNNYSSSITNTGEESVLKSLEKYSPTAEDEDEEEDYFANTSAGGSTLDEASQSQQVSFGVNSASEEARMLDIPLPPPIEMQSDAPPTSFHNILQLPPGAPANHPVQMEVKKKNLVLIGKSPVARLTFGKQVMKLKPMSIFSAEDSDSEALPEKTPLPSVSGTHDGSSLQSSNDMADTKSDYSDLSGIKAEEKVKITDKEIIEEEVMNVEGNSVVDIKAVNVGLDSSPLSKKSRWDQEALKNEDSKNNAGNIKSSSLLYSQQPSINSMLEKQFYDNKTLLNISEVRPEKVKERGRKEPSRSPTAIDRKKKRERSHSVERDRKRRDKVGSPRYRGRFSRDRRRDFRKRSRSKDRRTRRDSPHREYSPNRKKNTSPNKSLRRSPSNDGEHKKIIEKSQRPENSSNHELSYEPPTNFDPSWNRVGIDLIEVKESYNSSPKKKESLSDWESPERKYSSPPPNKDSPKRKQSPSPFHSPRNSPIKRKSPDHYRRKESPDRRYSPRRSSVERQPWKRSSPDRRRSPYSPRRSSPSRRRITPDRKRPCSPYRRRLSPSPERKYSRYLKKSPVKNQSYSISPNREENWKWDEETGAEKAKTADNDHFSKWDYDHSQNDVVNDYQTSLADSTISDSELVKESVPASPKRMSLDERLKIELGHTSTEPEPPQPQSIPLYHNFYYPPPTAPERVNYYPPQPYGTNPQPPPSRLPPDWNPSVHPPQLPNKLVQVGNVLQVVPTEAPLEPVYSAPPPKVIRGMEILPPKVVQVGNMLQVVPSQEPPPPPPPKQNVSAQFGTIAPPSPVAAPVLKLTVPPPPPQQAPPQPVSIISLPFPPGDPNMFLKLEEKDRRKKEKELRKQRKEEKAARRMLRKAMLKKKLAEANEGENEANAVLADGTLNETSELDSSKSSVTLPSPDKGILISIKDVPIITTSSKKKSVSFADGIKPGEGTSPSGGEEHPLSPPPLIRKTVKKRKKRKVKVRIIRIDNNAKEEESEEDDLSPPPPPPGTPPPEAYIEYTASGRYLYPVPNPQSFPGNQEGAAVFPAHPVVAANPNPVVQFSTPPPPQQR